MEAKRQIESVSADATTAILALKAEHKKEVASLKEQSSVSAMAAVKTAVAAARSQAAREHELR